MPTALSDQHRSLFILPLHPGAEDLAWYHKYDVELTCTPASGAETTVVKLQAAHHLLDLQAVEPAEPLERSEVLVRGLY